MFFVDERSGAAAVGSKDAAKRRHMPLIFTGFSALFLLMAAARGADVQHVELDRQFRDTVHPFVTTYCVTCHSGEKPKADLDLTPFTTPQLIAKDHQRWALVLQRLREGDMPPQKAKQHPTPAQRQQVVEWLESLRTFEAQRNAGDPGTVLARRLSNAEYDYTIRDLIGF